VILSEEELSLFEIAFYLRTPVYLLVDMPYDELQKWHAYFQRRPYEWRDDVRAYSVMSSFGVKQKASDIFPSLKALNESQQTLAEDMIDSANLRRSSMFSRMLSARNGDTLGALNES
jgi:hypothetical protein